MQQQTIRNIINFQGIGIHSGKPVNIAIKPTSTDMGIVFVRTDLNNTQVPVKPAMLANSSRATILNHQNIKIATPEHLLAALYGLGIDNSVIEIDTEEVPIMDGSAMSFVKAIFDIGIEQQTKQKKELIITKPILVKNGDCYLLAEPASKFKISYILDYPETFIGQQVLALDINTESFIEQIAPARTYGFYNEVKELLENNLAKGGSIDNAVVIEEHKYRNELRFPDELCRHKILDLIGDLSVVGKAVKGHFIGVKSGHLLNKQMVEAISLKT